MKRLLIFLMCVSAPSFASLPPAKNNQFKIERILAEKNESKFQELKNLGPGVYSSLRTITFSQDRTLGIRWQAFMAMVRLGEREALPEINSALKSPDWFLRDAALRVLPVLDKDLAYKAAISKLNDSALVVRTAAVDALTTVKNPACVDKLWGQLYSRENYMKRESLWIRRHIVVALADMAPVTDEERFVKILDDADSTLFEPAIHGLERLTGKKLGDTHLPAAYKRYYWKKWYNESFEHGLKNSKRS